MASFGKLQHMFQKPLPENPTLLESLSLNPIKPIDDSSFTEIFGELHFKEHPLAESETPPSSLSSINLQKLTHNYVSGSKQSTPEVNFTTCHKKVDSFSSLNSESLQLCTEGLGFESSDEVEDLKSEYFGEEKSEKVSIKKKKKNLGSEDLSHNVEYPPPISCISRSGKPCVYFRSYRDNGRFVLKEIRIPTQEFLHAYREDGRLKLHFVMPDDEVLEEQDEEEEEEDDDDEEIVDEEENDCTEDQDDEDKEIHEK